jgi:hypothetical protein
MAEGVDEAAAAFASEIAPQTRPRDQGGKFVATKEKPEPMFGARPIEGDPETGDTSDGGDDPRLRRHEREIAKREPALREPDDSEVEDNELEPDEIGHGPQESDDEDDEELEREEREEPDSGERYEVTVDGESHEVTLKEALAGYIRQETFHKRQAALMNVQQGLEDEYKRLQSNWQLWDKARRDYEEDFSNMIPREPNWDDEFAKDPHAAHRQQRTYQILYGKLAASQKARADRDAAQKEEDTRRLNKYAVEGFEKFVEMHRKRWFHDNRALQKNLRWMRGTAKAAGFSDFEVETVYDPRMLTILLKASKYDRAQANRLKPVDPSRGKTLTPGAATPLGNARRSGFDDAQRKLASSGKLEDAAEVLRRMF